MPLSIDIEITNRCNAVCHFCPRDQTPHQGLMYEDVFDKSLERAVEYRGVAQELLGVDAAISICGLGEPLLNKRAPAYVAQARSAGFDVSMSSNGSLLTEEKGRALLDAGLQQVLVNVGEEGDDYEAVYGLPFERTLENVVRFHQMARGRCKVHIVLVDHRRDAAHIAKMKAFWQSHGLNRFYTYDIMNRGGALFVDHMQFESYPQLGRARELLAAQGAVPLCGAPFAYLFIGYDGNYYLCCSDWKKEAPLGSVFDASFLDVTAEKLRYVSSREVVCKTCNLDPLNKLTDALRAVDDGESEPRHAEEELAAVAGTGAIVEDMMAKLGVPMPEVPAVAGGAGRRLIPVRSE